MTFPATLALAGAVFTAMLQLSLVCERWPLSGLELRWSGLVALALSWAAGTGTYYLFVNLGSAPAADRAAAGLRNPGGPIAGPDFGSALIAVGVWQTLLFIALRGWPVNTITRRPLRLFADNGLVIGLGPLASYADGVQWTRATPDEWITTAALSYAGAGIILHVGIVLRWPFGLKTGSPDESAPCNCQ